MGRFGVISDIRKAFLQVSVREEDRDFLRFLWWENETGTIKVYRHCRVVFGLTSSPFLLAATINYHLDKVQNELTSCGTSIGNGSSISEDCGLILGATDVIKLLRNSFYIDNCVVSLNSEKEVQVFVKEASRIMMEGMFELRGWVWNSSDKESANENVPVLGLNWNTGEDVMSLDLRSFEKSEDGEVTKRKMLSIAHRLFDPLGLVCPVTLIPKKLVQDTWKSKQGWDEPVPEETATKFKKWKNEIMLLKDFCVPRILFTDSSSSSKSFHVFADASSTAYAAVVFLRIREADDVKVKLVMARNRLSTIKKINIPRLELLACVIAARLWNQVKEFLNLDLPTYFWTDSSNAFHWITKKDNWAEFVWNRVSEIRKSTNIESWRHIPGKDNPADLPSRGCTSRQFMESKWWEGPSWLYLEENEWPQSKVTPNMDIVNSEVKKRVASNMTSETSPAWYERFQDEKGVVDIVKVLWSLAHGEDNPPGTTVLNYEEWRNAEIKMLKLMQKDMFIEGEKVLQQLRAGKDEDGIWRVRTRITRREDNRDFLYPVLLKASHPMSSSLVDWKHKKMHHCGVGTLLCVLRERFWIIGARRLARKVVHSCVECRRFYAQNVYPEEGPLPLNRVKDAVVFEVTGIDLGGPLYLKDGDKAWFVVFTCAVYRAVHLELVLSLSTKALVGAMERFISRRICPSVIYSDNGTNLVGVRNEFMKKGVNIDWKLNPPAAPWWGGFWERVVGLVKKLLVRLLQNNVLNHEEMLTVLAKCEEAVNARPLTHLSDDPMDLAPLTPATFLVPQKLGGTPTVKDMTSCDFGKEYEKRKRLMTHFKKRFRDEYLSRLVHHNKKKSRGNLKEGDLVMIELDNKKRLQWPLARVMELVKSPDGICRVVKLKTDQGVLVRPVQRVYPLEVETKVEEDVIGIKPNKTDKKPSEPDKEPIAKSDGKEDEIVITRSGRESRKPARFRDG